MPQPLCKRGSALKAWKKVQFTEQEQIVLKLHKNRIHQNNIMITSISTIPLIFYKRYNYIDCYFGNEHKKRR